MKTIKEAATELHKSTMFKSDLSAHPTAMFEAAVKFAEEWLPIERNHNGEMTSKQEEEIKNNCPFLIKDDYCTDDYCTIEFSQDLSDYYLYDGTFTLWRPLNRR
jgi:hypothetical protein